MSGPAAAEIDEVSLSVTPGEFVAVVGPSGGGKSTVMRLLLGFEQPWDGSVTYDGHDLAGRPRILLLDEATSALDNVTQAVVMRTVISYPGTRLVVAHRMSTVRGADRVVVVAGSLDPETTMAVERLRAGGRGPEPLRVLRPGRLLTAAEVVGLCLSLSDRACASWVLDLVGVAAVRDVVAGLGCAATTVMDDREAAGGPIVGRTTARDALCLVAASQDAARYPLTANALQHGFRDTRIPLGATGLDVRIAHKTGTLLGVADDAAVIECDGGTLRLAFLTEEQHVTLVSGYEMGICTRGLLQTWGLTVRRGRSLT
jgi:hypothetical protein